MAITDLTGTKWLLNEKIDIMPTYISFNIDFYYSDDTTHSQLEIYSDGIYAYIAYYPNGGIVYDYMPDDGETYLQGEWWNEDRRTITITGGSDATNAALISWLESNAEQQIIENKKNMYVGGNKVSKVMVGDKAAKKILIGDKEIYNYTPPSTVKYITSIISSASPLVSFNEVYILEIDLVPESATDLFTYGDVLDYLTPDNGKLTPSSKIYEVSKKYLVMWYMGAIPVLTVENYTTPAVLVPEDIAVGYYSAIFEIKGDGTITWNFRDDD